MRSSSIRLRNGLGREITELKDAGKVLDRRAGAWFVDRVSVIKGQPRGCPLNICVSLRTWRIVSQDLKSVIACSHVVEYPRL